MRRNKIYWNMRVDWFLHIDRYETKYDTLFVLYLIVNHQLVAIVLLFYSKKAPN